MNQLPVVENKYTHDAIAISNEPILKSAILRMLPSQLQHSKLLETFRQCNRCPLGAKTKIIQIGKEQKTIQIPAVCSYYEKDKKTCPIDKIQYVELVKDYYMVLDTPEYEEEIAKYLMTNIVSDAMMARDVDVIEKGRPGFTTNKHMETAVRLFDSIVKLKTGSSKHLHLHSENVADKLVDMMFLENKPIINIVMNNKQKKLNDFEVIKNGQRT